MRPPYCAVPNDCPALPPPPDTIPPCVSSARLVIILITPLTAFAPHTEPPGPRMTSILSMSSSGTSNDPNKLRRKLLSKRRGRRSAPANCSRTAALNPRALMAQVLALICATSSPGTMRSKSGILVAPERRMSSWVITKIAAATCDNFCSFFETEVTSVFIRSSRLSLERSSALLLRPGWNHRRE